MTTFLLVDNGSIKAPATLQLRCIAQQLSQQNGQVIYPVSLQHAQRIPAEALNGIKATLFADFLQQKLQEGERDFIILPLFFGNSRALTAFIPEQKSFFKQSFGNFNITIADVLYPLPQGEPLLVNIIYEHIQQTALDTLLPLKNLVLVDHGSPLPQVTQVRNAVRQAVQLKLNNVCLEQLEQAVMERRIGQKYDFNGILLKEWLIAKAEQGENSAIVALLFSLPGRHAGKDGDIMTICQSVMQHYPHFKIAITPLVGEHPLLLTLLCNRLDNSELGNYVHQ